MLELQDLCLKAGNFQIDKFSLKVPEGICHVLMGPTGVGKTLVLETICGLHPLVSGKILLAGNDLTGKAVEKRGISYVPQDLALFPHLSVKENIFYGLKIRSLSAPQYNCRITQLIEALGISHLLDRSTLNLSGGERQRAALARALAAGNKILLLDEPFSALHESMKRELWLLLKDLQKQYQLTVLMVTHQLEEALFLGEQLTVFLQGGIVQTGSKHEILRFPRNARVAEFMGVQNIFRVRIAGEDEFFSDELKTIFKLNRSSGSCPGLNKGDIMLAGIRARDLRVLPYAHREQMNIVRAVIKDIYDMGDYLSLTAVPEDGEGRVRICAETPAGLEYIKQGGRASIIFPEEKILCFPE